MQQPGGNSNVKSMRSEEKENIKDKVMAIEAETDFLG